MRKFKFNPLVLAMAVCTLPIGAYAQDTGDNTVEEVLVTGSFRDSLANAMNIKRNQSGFVDAIVASDIAEFPDNNLAESLQRVPGVAISRSGGEGRQITVRGLGPTFTTVRLNGMETMSSTGGTDAIGGNNRGRGFDFNTFSSDLFSSLTVRKTNAAEVQEGSLGATVDLKAAQPFDYDGFVFSASGNLGYNDKSEETDPAAAMLVSNIFADGKFGVLASLSYSERNVQDDGTSTGRWSSASGDRFNRMQLDGAATATVIPADHELRTSFHPRLPRYDSYQHEMERLGASLSLQFRPTDSTEISVDSLFAKFDTTREETFFAAVMNGTMPTNVSNQIDMIVTDYKIENNNIISADVSNARLWSENRFDDMSTDFSQTTVTLKQDFTDTFRMKAMIGTTKSDYDNPIQNTVIMIKNGQNFTYDYSNYDSPVLTFGDSAYEKAGWAISSNGVRQRPQATLNENNAGTLSFEWDTTEFLKLKSGVDYKDFNFETTENRIAEQNYGVNLQSNPDYIVEYDSGLGEGRNWVIPNRSLIMSENDLFAKPLIPQNAANGMVNETTTGVFIQADFNFDLGSVPVRGDIGVRRFETDQSSTGLDNFGTPITVDHSYSDTLPSLNLVVEPIEDLLFRFAASEGIARSGLNSLMPTTNVSVSGNSFSVTTGNPYLEPTKATSYDLGAEWYFGEGASIGVTLFTKELETFAQRASKTTTYTALMDELGLPLSSMTTACGSNTSCTADASWQYSTTVNSPGGDLDGYEISYQQPFTFLPGFWSNFGVITSYTSVESKIDYLNATTGAVERTSLLQDLSEETVAGTLYYEQDNWGGRVSVVSRSDYLTTPVGRNGNYEEGTNGTVNVDATVNYSINDNWKVTFEALNITDEADDQWVGNMDSNERLSYYHQTGTQYNLGVQYKY
ncbi:MAG: TonB-dependent receptor [Cellvibrio sp.]|uniref:TonB-dependent receptor n=1 Tax=Cellvibrio sp. TaxID=1965322 RepID=UPI00271E3EE6|nr:TonB-dependent receptor [Cellvibrio sp.]